MSIAMPFEQGESKGKAAPPLPVVIEEICHDRLYFVCLLCVLVGTIKEGAVFWLPKIFTDVLHLGEGSLIFLMLVPLAKLAGVFAARRLLGMVGESVKRGVQVMLSIGCASCAALVLTSSHTSLLTLALIALLLAVINGANWFMISYLPLHFAERNIVATLVGCFDFSTYIGASIMTGVVSVALARFSWVALPLMWMGITALALLLAFGCAGSCLALKGKRRA
jgi:sugar phosphate permease